MRRLKMAKVIQKFDIDAALDCVDLRFTGYTPSQDAFEFFNLIRVFFGEDFEVPNPIFHYFIVDMLYGRVKVEDFPYTKEILDTITIDPHKIGIISTRGSAKSTITSTFYPIVAAIRGRLPVTGPLSHILILSDSQQGGARDQARLMGNAFQKSKFATEWFESVRCTDTEIELIRKGAEPIEKRHMLIKFKGAQALSLDSKLFTDTGIVTMGNVQVGDRIFGADGKLCMVTQKSEVFNRDMYELVLKDGRRLKVSADHINSVLVKQNNYTNGSAYVHMNITTEELLQLPMWKTYNGYKTPLLWVENIAPLEYNYKELPIDPYTLGLYLGDGYFHKNDGSAKLTGQSDDIDFYLKEIPYESGYRDKQDSCDFVTLKGLGKQLRLLDLAACKACDKFIPTMYMYSAIEQRIALLQGLLDTDGTVREGNKGYTFVSTSKQLADNVIALVRSIGGIAYIQDIDIRIDRNYPLYRVAIKSNIVLVRLPRKVARASTKQRASKVAIVAINKIDTEPSQCIAVDNALHEYVAEDYIRTHNTGGIRSGSRNPITGDRYALIIADDVIKNEAEAYSETIMNNVTTALMSDARNAMRAKNTQYVLINTPFHKRDPIYMMVESGGYTPLVTPICKVIYEGMPKEEFIGLWEDMHDYDSVMDRYLEAVSTNTTRMFNQELMLRVSNDEDRLVTDEMIQWYDRKLLMKLLDGYSIYITTDLTTTSAAKSDFSAIAAWAVNSEDDWFLLDLCLKRQELQEQYDTIFRMHRLWSKGGRYIEVGIEIDGQQKAHLFTLKQMMMKYNHYFSFAREKGAALGKEGISSKNSGVSKIDRFRYAVPRFQNHKIYFPEQMRDTPELKEALKQLKGATHAGFSTHDDFPDVITQMTLIDIKLPTSSEDLIPKTTYLGDGYWGEGDNPEFGWDTNNKNSIVF